MSVLIINFSTIYFYETIIFIISYFLGIYIYIYMDVKRKTFRKAHKTHRKKSKSNKVKTHKIRALRKQRKTKKGKKQKRKTKKRRSYKKGGAIPKEQLETLRNSQLSCSEKEILYNPDVDGRIIDENTPDNIVEGAINDCSKLNPGLEQSDCEKVVLRKRKRVTKLGDLFEKLLKGEITSEAMATQLMPMVNMVEPNITSQDVTKGLNNTDPQDLEELADVVQDIQKIQEMTEELYEKYNFKSELYQCKLDEQPKEVVGGGEELTEKCDSIIKEYTSLKRTTSDILSSILILVCLWIVFPVTSYYIQKNRGKERRDFFGELFESGCDIRKFFDSLTGIKGYRIKNLTKITDKTLNKIKLLYIKKIIKHSNSYYFNGGCKIKTQKNDVIITPKYRKIKLYFTNVNVRDNSKKYVNVYYIEKVYLINYDKINNKIQLTVIKQKNYDPLHGYEEPIYSPYGYVNRKELVPNNNNIYFKEFYKDSRKLHPNYIDTNHEHFKKDLETEYHNIDLELNDKEMAKLGKKINNIQSCTDKEEINDIEELTQTYRNYLNKSEITWEGYKIEQKFIDAIKKFHPEIKL